MTTDLPRFTTWCTLGVALMGGALACDLGTVSTTPAGAAAGAIVGCPDVSSVQSIARIDWAAEFGLDAQAAAKLEAGLRAAVGLRQFAGRIDADLRAACGGLATDLGASGSWRTGSDACRAAAQAMAAIKGKLGGAAKVTLAVEPPKCAASMDAMADCVAECDANIEPGRADVQCQGGELVGQCGGQCSGTCHMDAGGHCNGTCRGSCDTSFQGRCGGECTGKCNGADVRGAQCSGTCQGSCSAAAEGTCGGRCSGSCKLQGSASCQGDCQGSCSAEMKAPRCTGKVEPPKASAECKAQCDAQVSARIECTPARVIVRVDRAANASIAAQYSAALQKHLPGVLQVAIGLKDRAMRLAADVQALVAAAQNVVASARSNAQTGARLAACISEPFQAAIDSAASMRANVSVSVEVQASASVSGSAGG